LAALIAMTLRLPARSKSKKDEEIVGEYILVRDIH
jgi:hypothetical protein